MDPDQCLKEIRLLISQCGNVSPEVARRNYAELADKFYNLDRWLSTGGFKPEPWQYAERKLV